MEAAVVRDYLPFLPGWTLWVMYPLALVVAGITLAGLARRLQSYGGGLGELLSAQGGKAPGWRRALADAALQRKVMERPYPATLHLGIFYGMVFLTLGTALVFLDEDILKHLGGARLMQGWFYSLMELLLDLAGLALLVGVVLALVRRLVLRPPFLPARRATSLILAGLLFMVVTGFLLEAYRLGLRGERAPNTAFVGEALALLLPGGDGEGGELLYYRLLWWTHFAGAMALIGGLAFSGLSHILTIPLSVAAQDPARPRTRLTTPFNLADLLEATEEVELVSGTPSTADLPPALRLAADSCVACGRCHAECPAAAAGRALSPRDFVQDLKLSLESGEPRPAADFEQAVWACTNCYACEEACPARIRHVDLVLDFRRALVDENRLDGQKLAVLQALDRNQNPFKLPSHERAAWLAEVSYAEEVMFEAVEEPEWLYWLGCSAAYDSRASQVARATMDLLRAGGVRYAVLGPAEGCCGEPAKRLGEEGRFQTMALTNMEVLRETGARGIVTHCPHCLNVLGHEYGSLGFELPVVHHTTLLARLLDEGKLPSVDPAKERAAGTGQGGALLVYHEPCNLARSGDGPVEARAAAARLVPGLELPERSGRRTFCCGGGAGNMWYSVEQEETRISHLRVKELLDKEPEAVISSCPFCLSMLSDAMGSFGDARRPVVDVAELVAARVLDTLAVASAVEPVMLEEA